MAEPDSGLALAVRARPDPIIAPKLVIAEVLNATWLGLRRGQLTVAQFTGLAPTVARSFDRLVSLRSLAARTAVIAQQLDHPAYDCFYLALAEREAAPLVTADKRLLGRLAGTGWAGNARDLASFGAVP